VQAAVSSAAAPNAALARRQAREILAEPRFHAAPVPQPLHGALHTLGRLLEAPLEAVEELVSSLAPSVPGGKPVVWAVLAVALLVVGGLLAARYLRRSLAEPRHELLDGQAMPPATARELEADATRAEDERRYADAVRLRFRAGLVRLAERDMLVLVDSTPNVEVGRLLASGHFDRLARDFDEIVYGGRAARPEDAESARREWRDLLRSLGSQTRPSSAHTQPAATLPRP
jgi:hypothetical protein